MKVSEAYKLSMYKDYGPLGEKEHIRLVKNIKSGKICVQKIMDGIQSDIIDFRTKDLSLYFPELFLPA